MVEKEASQNEAQAGIDLLALELEIDREIDALFIPAAKMAQRTVEESKRAGEARSVSEPGPGAKIQEGKGGPGADIDLDALDSEIDKEIDNLFVPAARPDLNKKPVRIENEEQPKMMQGSPPEMDEQSLQGARKAGGPSLKPTGEAALRVDESKRAGEAQGVSEPRPGAGFDLDALHSEIDKEIDNLFVPAARPDLNKKPVRIENEEQPKMMQDSPPAMDEQSFQGARKAGGPSLKPTGEAALRAEYDESPPDHTLESQRYHFDELSRLIEKFNAAYLSLDWEFSRENVRKFLAALNQLEPFASRSADAGSVLRILNTILKRLVDRPHAINSRLVQLIRDSQGLLAHLLLIEGEVGPHEKQTAQISYRRFSGAAPKSARSQSRSDKSQDRRTRSTARAWGHAQARFRSPARQDSIRN